MPRDAAATVADGRRTADVFAAVAPGLALVEERLHSELGEAEGMLSTLGTHLLAGGKRLRPALVLLAGSLCGAALERLVPVAAACEIVHMATLVHDDLVDASDRRRGLPTVHAKWGVPMSVLIGDHLFAKAFAILAAEGDPVVVRLMSEVVSHTCAGEIEEISTAWDLEVGLDGYMRRVEGKTGYFIGACCRMGAAVGGAPAAISGALGAYGLGVGDCYQVVDDLLDLTATEGVLGKPVGSDLRAGVYTLPVVWALQGAHGSELRRLLAERPVTDAGVAGVRQVLERSGALAHAAQQALKLARQAQAALSALPQGLQRDALHRLADELTHRVS